MAKQKSSGWLDSLTSTLNPFNWGVEDYSDKGNFNTAFAQAKKAGEKEFMYNFINSSIFQKCFLGC
jgi:hypothetical protein